MSSEGKEGRENGADSRKEATEKGYEMFKIKLVVDESVRTR